MRNQTWEAGQLVRDIELTVVGGAPTAIDHIMGTQRPASPEEIARLRETEGFSKREAAKERAIAAIRANQTGAPWGRILYDLAVAQRLIEE